MLTIKNLARNSCNSCSLFNVCNCSSVVVAFFVLLCAGGCTPAGPKALLQGENLIEKGKFPQAIEKLKLATSLISTNAQAWNYLGLAYHYSRQPDDAEKTYRRALLIDHDLSEAHYNLGCLYLEQKKNDPAKNEFIAYTLRRANSIDALLKLGTAQLRLNELSSAEKTFQDALRLSPQNPEALNGLGCVRAHQRGRANEAAGYFRAALKAQTNYPPATLNWAIVSQQSQDKRFALQKYHEYISLKPPPENVQAVKTVAFDLERELNSPPSASSSTPVSPPANVASQKPPPTNINHPSTLAKTESQMTKASSNPPAKTALNNSKPPPVVSQPLPSNTDTVRLSPEPTLKPAQDISSSKPVQSSNVATGRSESPNTPSTNRVQAEQLFAEGRRSQQDRKSVV